MSLYKLSWVVLHCWVVAIFLFKAHGDGSGISVNFLKAPNSTTSLNSANFLFNVSVDGNEVLVVGSNPCKGSSITCKLDNGITTDCGGKEVSYSGLQDGNHTFEVCSTASPGVRCSTYNWIVDTIPPTGYITSPHSVTNALNVSVNISFTEPCTGEDGKQGFDCSSVNACNLLVHGDGQVIPSSLVTLVPTRKYTLVVALSSNVTYGNVTLEMDRIFCTDSAGNKFIKSENSTLKISFDRRNLLVNISSAVPEKLLQLDSGNMSLLATNNQEDLKLYLNFSQPVRISSTDVLNSLSTTKGKLIPIVDENLGDQTYGFQVVDVPPSFATINISFNSDFISRKLGNPVSPIEPITFVYDSRRPRVRLSTKSRRTTQDSIPIWIQFTKPVLGFNESCNISISGGHLLRSSFKEINRSTAYFVKIQADDDFLSVNVPENITADVFGNKNQAEALKVTHDSEPTLSRVTSTFVTSTFGITCLAQGMLAVSTASLASSGASPSLMSDPATNLFLSLGHIQLVALSKWLPVKWPNEYYDYAKALEWSIPYFNLPWEKEHAPLDNAKVNSKLSHLEIHQSEQPKELNSHKAVDLVTRRVQPRTPTAGDFETTLTSENTKMARSQYFDKQESDGWRDFKRSMFWLAVIGGSLIFLHALAILLIRNRQRQKQRDSKESQIQREPEIQRDLIEPQIQKDLMEPQIQRDLMQSQIQNDSMEHQTERDSTERQTQRDSMEPKKKRDYGPLTFPRFEIFCIIVALPCISKASTGLIRGGTPSGVAVGTLLLGVVFLILLSFFLFLLVGVTLGMLFLYEEECQEGPEPKWVLPIIRVIGPRLRSEWKWKDDAKQIYLKILGPLFEDLRGVRKHMLRQGDRINPSNEKEEVQALESNPRKNVVDGNTKDASLPHKMLSIPRTYYTLLETVRQVILGILGGAYIADDESSKSPAIITLTITCFFLFFLVLLKPFVSKRGLVVEIISVVSEVALFTFTLLLLVQEFSPGTEAKIRTCMVILPFVGYVAGLINQFYSLYKQIKHLDPSASSDKSFVRGLQRAFSEFFTVFLPQKMTESFDDDNIPPTEPGKGGSGETGSSAYRNGSSSTTDKPGMKQLRAPTKSLPSSSNQASGGPNDASSTSGNPSIPPPSKSGLY